MDFFSKLKETLYSVLPITIIVLILHFTISPLGNLLIPFLSGSVMLLFGFSLFLSGTDIGMVPIGERLGSHITSKKSLTLILIIGFFIGFSITYAEPDVSVLALRIHAINPSINENILKLVIALGLGIFIDLGLLRMFKRIKLKYIMLICYTVVFLIIPLIDQSSVSISFDSSGATTGPLAVPFILAMGIGVSSSVKGGGDDSFGLTGVSSVGPILAVSVMMLICQGSATELASEAVTAEESTVHNLIPVFISVSGKTAIGFAPLVLIIIILQTTLLKFPKVKFRKISLGLIYSFLGIVIFLTGVEFGFSEVGFRLGKIISLKYPSYISVLIALLFGAIAVLAEPAVWVLVAQVEEVSAGRIKKRTIMFFLIIGVSSAVALAMFRIMYSLNYLWLIYGVMGIALALMSFTPPLFSGIAFDSGGTVTGPMCTSFLLSFILGTSASAQMGFGLIGLIASSPLITIQILGIVYKIKENRTQRLKKND